MLPLNHAWKEGSMSALIETTPQMDLVTQDIEHLVEGHWFSLMGSAM